MRLFADLRDVPEDFGPSAVTVGKFDGVHRGHTWLVSRVAEEARPRGLAAVALTFDRHPLSLIQPQLEPQPIVSLAQKVDLLGRTGLDATLVLPFTDDLAQVTPEEFVRDILVAGLRMRLIVVGRDFRFGARGAGDVRLLRQLAEKYGFELVIAHDETTADGRRASSTWIRELLADGDVRTAGEVLGRPHSVRGEVVHGAKRGRELGYPTANLTPDLEGLIPADGVYAGWFRDGDSKTPAAISVGHNPTFEGVPRQQVEAHLLGVSRNLYGVVAEVEFVERLRGMEKFDDIQALMDRMASDVERTRELLTP